MPITRKFREVVESYPFEHRDVDFVKLWKQEQEAKKRGSVPCPMYVIEGEGKLTRGYCFMTGEDCRHPSCVQDCSRYWENEALQGRGRR